MTSISKSLFPHRATVETREMERDGLSSDPKWIVKHRGWKGRYEEISAKERTFQRRDSQEVTARWYARPVDITTTKDRMNIEGYGVFEIEQTITRNGYMILELKRWD